VVFEWCGGKADTLTSGASIAFFPNPTVEINRRVNGVSLIKGKNNVLYLEARNRCRKVWTGLVFVNIILFPLVLLGSIAQSLDVENKIYSGEVVRSDPCDPAVHIYLSTGFADNAIPNSLIEAMKNYDVVGHITMPLPGTNESSIHSGGSRARFELGYTLFYGLDVNVNIRLLQDIFVLGGRDRPYVMQVQEELYFQPQYGIGVDYLVMKKQFIEIKAGVGINSNGLDVKQRDYWLNPYCDAGSLSKRIHNEYGFNGRIKLELHVGSFVTLYLLCARCAGHIDFPMYVLANESDNYLTLTNKRLNLAENEAAFGLGLNLF
jgi:hypothetical protein